MALTKVPSNLDATVAVTQSASDNSTNIATTAYVTTAIANLVDGAPSTLNTLDEIAAALNDDAALNTTLTNSIAAKLPLAGGTLTGNLVLGNSVKATFGTGSALQIFHDGSNSYIQSKTGNFNLTTDNGNEFAITAVNNGAVSLFHNGSKKIETVSGGATVTGNLEATSLTAGTANPNAELLYLLGSGHTGHGASNTVSLASIAESTSGNTMGLWIGSMTNQNTAVIGTRTASGNLAIQTYNGGWAERVRIDYTGKVGIGTDAPSQPLQINSSGGYNLFFGRGNSVPGSSDPWLGLFNAATIGPATYGWGFYDSNSDGSFQIWNRNNSTTGAVALTIKRGGNVGIGTSNPFARLHVKADTGGSDSIVRIRNENTTARTTTLQLEDYSGTLADGVLKFAFPNAGSTTDSYLGLLYNSAGLYVAPGGNVGIGTSSPDNILQVLKSSNDVTLLHLSHSSSNASTPDYGHYGEILIQGSTHCKSGIRAYSNGYQTANSALAFFTNQHGGSYAERMRITGNGNVGIGTTDPQATLHLKSTVASTGPSLIFENTNNAQAMNIDYYNNSGSVQSRIRYSEGPGSFEIMPNSSANAAMILLYNGNVGVGSTNPFTNLHVADTGWSSGAPYGSIVHIDGGSNHDNNWGHLHVNQSGTSANIGGRIRLGTAANNGYGGNPIAGITALNKDTSNGTYGNLEFSTRPSGGTNTMRMEISHNGHIKLSGDHGIRVFTGYFNAGTVSTNFDVSGYGAGVMMMTAAFNHYGFIQGYGCYKRAICSNGPGHGGTAIEVNDVDSAISTTNGGSWTFHRQSGTQSSYRITKNAGTYAGGGYYWVRFEGNMGV